TRNWSVITRLIARLPTQLLARVRAIYRSLPQRLQAPVRAVYRSLRTGKLLELERFPPRKSYQGRHVIIVGLFQSAAGLGRAAELVARTLEGGGTIVSRVDVTAEFGVPILNPRADVVSVQRGVFPDASDVVIVLNPDYYA